MKTIVCYGDSNTWGHKSYIQKQLDPTKLRFAWDERWTGLVQQKLGADYRIEEEGLNGRTTMFDDPMSDCRNGLAYIDTCMLTKYPVDMVIIMLGTNDTKEFFHNPPFLIAHGAGRIIDRIQKGAYGVGGGVPEILLVSPIRLNPTVAEHWLECEFGKSCLDVDAKLAENYARVAKEKGVYFMNAGEFVMADDGDGVHMSAEGHAVLAEKMYEKIKEILG